VPQAEALEGCQLSHICQRVTRGENTSYLNACALTEQDFCYFTQLAQLKVSQLAQVLFVHGSQFYFT